MRLSILIVSLESRSAMSDKLLNILNAQLLPEVEILLNVDNGQKIIGQKRNELMRQAIGDYVCYIDDDDLVSPNYVSKIMEATEKGPDCVGISGIITTNGNDPKTFIHSLQYKTWFEKNDIYYRSPNHLNPIKRSIAKNIRFPVINHGEDQAYSTNILPLLENEVFISDPLYYYLFRTIK